MKNLYIKKFILLLIISFTCSCHRDDNIINEKVVLEVNKIQISDYEFRKNFERFLQDKENIKNSSITDWLEDYRNNAILLNKAFLLGYENDSVVKTTSKAMANYILVKYRGFIWNKIEEPKLLVSGKEIKDAYNKTDSVYYFEYLFYTKDIRIPNLILSQINDSIIELKRISEKYPNLFIYGTSSGRWPLLQFSFARNVITNLKTGEISYPVQNLDGYFMFRVFKKEKVTKQPFKTEKTIIEQELYQVKENDVLLAFENKFNAQCKISYNLNNLNTYLYNINKTYKQYLNINKTGIKNETNNQILATYYLKDTLKSITITDFSFFINTYPLVASMSTADNIKENIVKMIKEKYLLRTADSLGLRNDKQFQLEYRNFKNRVMLNKYLQDSVYNNIEITEEEIEQFYTQKNDLFLFQPEYIIADRLEFNDLSTAYKNRYIIMESIKDKDCNNFNDRGKIKGLKSFHNNLKIYTNESLSKEIIDLLINSKICEIAGPVTDNNYACLYIKKEEGKLIKKPYKNVKTMIENQLKNEKFISEKNILLERIKKEYNIEVDNLEPLTEKMVKEYYHSKK